MQSSRAVALDHLDRMTDSTGLIQHAIYCIPRRESGYTIDDNARALRLCVHLWDRNPSSRMLDRVTLFLSLLEFARRPGGGFHNLMSYQRQWLGTDSTGDCQGQALRALAQVLGSSLPPDYYTLARELIDTAIPTLAELRSLRAQAYVIMGYAQLYERGVRDLEKLEGIAWLAAQHLVECYERSTRPEWNWFEGQMTYANAVLPHALFVAAKRWPEERFEDVATETMHFLEAQTNCATLFHPVGNNGWSSRGETKAAYDQQPLEAVTMADAALAAFELTGERSYLRTLHRSYTWFLGHNSETMPLADITTGGCCDGLQQGAVNRNQGAESTLAYLWTQSLYNDTPMASEPVRASYLRNT